MSKFRQIHIHKFFHEVLKEMAKNDSEKLGRRVSMTEIVERLITQVSVGDHGLPEARAVNLVPKSELPMAKRIRVDKEVSFWLDYAKECLLQ